MTSTVSKSVRLGGLLFEIAGMSEQGPRKENQDAFTIDAFEKSGTLAVADGMGGERGGRIAADTALQALLSAGPIRSLDAARHAFRAADQTVAQAALENPAERGGMGCALALLALTPGRGHPGWIGAYAGDVRILSRSPDGTVRLESRDHTPAFARWEAGEIGLDEITEAEGANRLQRAIGRGGEADAVWIPARPGWSYLLISDGVSKAMRFDELGEAMATPGAAAACDLIRRRVEERGPDDNYTAVVVRVLGGDGEDATDPEPPARPAVFNPVTPVTHSRRSPWGGIALVLALAALALAGWALWSGMQAQQRETAARAELAALRQAVDSLRADTLGADTAFQVAPAPGDTPPPAGAAPAPRAPTPNRP
jgi:serine/threonine protein phosphatase PrpC